MSGLCCYPLIGQNLDFSRSICPQAKLMILLLISSNPLFEEVILDLIARCEISEVISASPVDAFTCMQQSKPDVIILDNDVEENLIDKILATARSMENMRIVLVNPGDNDFVIVESRRSTIKKIEDLIQAIQ
jgi:DNA-binding NarL/FixJ family response regulator